MTEYHHPTLVHRIRRYTGPRQVCKQPHNTNKMQYCHKCQTYRGYNGCHSKLYVYSDGACSNNGYHDAESGIGVYFGPDSKHNISEALYLEDHPTSQRAELQAAITAIENAIQIMESDRSLIRPNYWRKYRRDIVLLTDSVYVCQGFNNWMDRWAVNGWTNSKGHQVANVDLFERLYDLKHAEPRSYNLEAVKIPREENHGADALAKASLDS